MQQCTSEAALCLGVSWASGAAVGVSFLGAQLLKTSCTLSELHCRVKGFRQFRAVKSRSPTDQLQGFGEASPKPLEISRPHRALKPLSHDCHVAAVPRATLAARIDCPGKPRLGLALTARMPSSRSLAY